MPRAYHWPGFETGERYDEPGMMALMRRYGARAQGRSGAAPLPVPAPPRILDVSQLGEVTFRCVFCQARVLMSGHVNRSPFFFLFIMIIKI